MTTYREQLTDRLIRLYGFENDIIIVFCELCENLADNEWNNKMLTLLVEAHEANPFFEEN